MIGFRVRVIVKPSEAGFCAYCPALMGLYAGGDTEEALQNMKDAVIAYLDSLIKRVEQFF